MKMAIKKLLGSIRKMARFLPAPVESVAKGGKPLKGI